MEAILLAGGLGTRLQSVLPDQQKCMATIAGKPFLEYLVDHLKKMGFLRFILATGHHHAQISKWVETQANAQSHLLSIEDHPLGTGGALLKALERTTTETVLVVNGDSFIQFDYPSLLSFHHFCRADISMLCTPVEEAGRFGSITTDARGRVTQWNEKGIPGPALINAGVYLISKAAFQDLPILPCSLEKEIIPAFLEKEKIYALATPGPLLDIGTPESLAQATGFLQAQIPSP